MTGERELTFLFTDVEGSTRLWEQYPASMGAAIERHERILRDAIERQGGSVFNTAGDGVCAVFPSPHQAVAAAIEGQRGLVAEPWETYAPGLRISARIAVDAGKAQSAAGTYLGPALNRLHRLMRTGHGGQILCGSAVAGEVSTGLDVELRYLGSHTLRDVSGQIRIFQIEAPGLPTAFPRLIVDRPSSTRLPYHPATMFGREDELKRIGVELRDRAARVVTLLGPGGVGKTTLAVALARELDDAFPDGVHFIDLSAVQEGALVVPTIARTLEIEDSLLGPEDALLTGLRARDLLLALDNCEQVVEEIARFVVRLMAETAHISVLTTSRAPLRIAAEREERIEPLPLPEQTAGAEENPAVQLFSEHARQVNARFSLNDVARPAVVEICRMVDGLPLAIELAAAWVRILDPATLRNRLADGAPLLRSDARDRPERHRTLTSTIDWSYQLLDPAAQNAFGRLAVFQSGIPLDGALTVLQAGDRVTFIEALEQLDRLVQANLLQPPVQTPDGPRYQMLQTIQEFALSTLAPNERTAASRAHAGYFAAMAASAEEHYRGAEASIWFDRLDANIDNVRAAMTWLVTGENQDPYMSLRMSTELWEYFDIRGFHREMRGLLAQAIDAAPNAPARELARAFALLGNAWLSNYEQAETFYRRSLDIASQSADDASTITATVGLGLIALMRGDHESSIVISEEILARVKSAGNPADTAQALLSLGHAYQQAGHPAKAIAPLEESLAISRQSGDEIGIAWVHKVLALTYLDLGRTDLSEQLLRQAIAVFESHGEQASVAFCQLDLTRVILPRDVIAASEVLGLAVERIIPIADVFVASSILDTGAAVLAKAGIPDLALELLGAVERWRSSTGTIISPTTLSEVEAARSLAMSALGQRDAEMAYSRGQSFSLRDGLLSLQQSLQTPCRSAVDRSSSRT